jgi:SAM-dependent methyltransferase
MPADGHEPAAPDLEWRQTHSDFWEALWRGQRASLGAPPSLPFQEWFELNWDISNAYWSEFLGRKARGRELLECGGATGRLPLHLARHGWQCTLVDITAEGPLLARKRFERGHRRGRFVTGDAGALPFADATFDVVYSNGLLDVLPDIQLAIREMVRVLRPGGLFVAATNPRRCSVQTAAEWLLSPERPVRRALSRRRWARPHQDRPAPGARGETTRRLPPRNDFSLGAHIVACEAAGLQRVRGHGVGLLPVVNLPGPLMRGYIHLTRASRPLWMQFNRCEWAWTAHWGVLLAVYGFKESAARN